MNKNTKTNEAKILMLRYQLERYQSMGNGTMCQDLIRQLRDLQNRQAMA